MAALPSHNMTIRFIATASAETDAFRECLESYLAHAFEFQLTADLSADLLEEMLTACQTVPEGRSLNRIVIVDPVSVSAFSNADLFGVPSVMCGHSNQDALLAFNAGVSLFFCLSASADTKRRQIDQLADSYTRLQEARKWRAASEFLAHQHACSTSRLVEELSQQQSSYSRPTEQIALRCGLEWQYVDLQSIRYVEAAGDYMCVYTQEETLIVRSTLTELAQRLPSHFFTRVNRSIIVNTQFVKRLIKFNSRVNYVELNDGSKVKISRRLMPVCHRQLDAAMSQL